MQNRIKPLLSFLCIGLFLVFALASELLDESTNTTIIVEDCAKKPNFTGTLTISIHYIGWDLLPVEEALCRIFITHQRVDNELDCPIGTVETQTINLYTDEFGRCTYVTPSFSHSNAADLFRVDVNVRPSHEDQLDGIHSFQQVKVAAYNVTSLDFFKTSPTPL